MLGPVREVISSGVVFDFDGTLVDSYTFRNLAYIHAANVLGDYSEVNGREMDRKVMAGIISDIELEMSARLLYDRKVWFREAIRRYNSTPLDVPDKVLSEAVLGYWNTIIEHSFPYPGTTDLLSSLTAKGISLGLISDTDGIKGMKLERLRQSGLRDFFDAVVVSGEDTLEVKPSMQPFLKICDILRVAPEHCLYVGDNPAVDVVGAKGIGMKTIIIRNSVSNFHEATTNPDCTVDRKKFGELKLSIGKLLRISTS